MEYVFHLLILLSIYGILAVALDLPLGQAGLISVAQGAFYGIGAYSSSLAMMRMHWPFLAALSLGIILSVVASIGVSVAALRLHEDYFIIATFAFQVIAVSLMNNIAGLTRGPLGISDIPPASIFGWGPASKPGFLILSAFMLVIAYTMADRMSSSPLGRVLRAIREDDLYAQAVGKYPLRFRIVVLAVSSGMTAAAGSLYAHYMTYIDPSSFDIMASILIISMVIIGGAGSRFGAIVGAAVVVLLPEGLRFVGLRGAYAPQVRELLYGVLLVTILIFRPKGIAGQYGFGR